jgi:hypothetical protein
MTKRWARTLRTALLLAAVVFVGACGAHPLGHSAGGAGATGTPVTPTAGATGAAGTTSAAGATGTAGAGGATDDVPPPTPTKVPYDADVLSYKPNDLVARVGEIVWGKAPDDLTIVKLSAGLPAQPTRGDARALAEKMMADNRALPQVYAFFRWWLRAGDSYQMEKSPTWYPELESSGLRMSLSYELELFGAGVTMDGAGTTSDDAAKTGAPDPGTFKSLLSIESTYANAPLQKLYGLMASPVQDGEWPRLSNPGRPGLLSLAGYIAPRGGWDRRWPSEIGMHVLQDLLCVRIPPEPASVAHKPTPDPTKSMRQLSNETANQAVCAACHKPVDGVGFAFLGYDALGRAQAMDGPDPIDDRGTLMFVRPERTFKGVAELGRTIAAAPEAQRCHAAKWLAFFSDETNPNLDATMVTPDDVDARSLEQSYAAFAVSGFKLRSLAAAVATSPAVLK